MAGISDKAVKTQYAQNKFRYGGKELQNQEFNDGSGLEEYDYRARMLDPQLGVWRSPDPMAHKFQHISPYASFNDNPILYTDPTGAATAPIYDEDGNFQGTDDQGLQGKAIVMDKKDFKQGMSHEDALKKNLGVEGLKDFHAVVNMVNSFKNLPARPDYDGFVTITEGVDWARAHPGAEANPTPENTLYIDASKLDFGNIQASDFKNGVGKSSPINLNTFGNFLESSYNTTLRATVYALGRVDMTLVDNNGNVKIVNNEATDYDWNRGGGLVRGTLIEIERRRADVNDIDGFKTFYYGTGKLRSAPPASPEPATWQHVFLR